MRASDLALTDRSQLPGCVDDYNECHPHRGLRMRFPREFIGDRAEQSPRDLRPARLEEA